jgi:hypothetical protein
VIRSGEHATWDAHMAGIGARSNIDAAVNRVGETIARVYQAYVEAARSVGPALAEALRRMP